MEGLDLGIEAMDTTHTEFFERLHALQTSSSDRFIRLFEELIEHTKKHFDYEESLMCDHNYYGLQEHLDEHINLLGEMQHFFEKAKKMRQFGLSYINHYAYEKFRRHIMNIDSQLAMFLKQEEKQV